VTFFSLSPFRVVSLSFFGHFFLFFPSFFFVRTQLHRKFNWGFPFFFPSSLSCFFCSLHRKKFLSLSRNEIGPCAPTDLPAWGRQFSLPHCTKRRVLHRLSFMHFDRGVASSSSSLILSRDHLVSGAFFSFGSFPSVGWNPFFSIKTPSITESSFWSFSFSRLTFPQAYLEAMIFSVQPLLRVRQ